MPRKTKENMKKSKKDKKQRKNIEEEKDIFKFDDEIVIGLKKIEEPKDSNKSRKIKKKRRQQQNIEKKSKDENDIIIKSKYLDNYQEKSENNKKTKKKYNRNNEVKKRNKEKKEINKKKKVILKLLRWITIIGIVIGGIIYAMLSPIFNIQKINVSGNSKISSETIISLSDLNINQNIFNFRTSKVIENIKQNAYIDQVEINRELPEQVSIIVKERKATFMLVFGNAYTYINNQGYILEITSEKISVPIIDGYKTPKEDIKEGNRLCTDDLERLEDVLKIMEVSESVDNDVKEMISRININDMSNYILTLEKEKKKVYLGDTTNLSTKLLWLNEFLDFEKKKEGSIYLNVNLNIERPYFREKI